jgi:hypothetical protein
MANRTSLLAAQDNTRQHLQSWLHGCDLAEFLDPLWEFGVRGLGGVGRVKATTLESMGMTKLQQQDWAEAVAAGVKVPAEERAVATTWCLNMNALSPAAKALLRASALLAPDGIPEDFAQAVAWQLDAGGAADACDRVLGDALVRGSAAGIGMAQDLLVKELTKYSLVSRAGSECSRSYSMHRLVQQVQRDDMLRSLGVEARQALGVACARAVSGQVRQQPRIWLQIIAKFNSRWLGHIAVLDSAAWQLDWMPTGGAEADIAKAELDHIGVQLLREKAALLVFAFVPHTSNSDSYQTAAQRAHEAESELRILLEERKEARAIEFGSQYTNPGRALAVVVHDTFF